MMFFSINSLLIIFQLVCFSMAKTTMVVKRHNINDQALSGSGYSYSMLSGDPGEYEKGRSLRILEDLGYDTKMDYHPDIERYGGSHHTHDLSPIAKEYHHIQPHGPPSHYGDYKFDVNNVLYHLPQAHDEGYIGYPYAPGYKHHYPHDYHYYPHPIYEDHFEDSDFLKHKKYNDEDYLKEGGKKFEDSEYAKHGEKENGGYKKEDGFEKGEKGKHEDFDKQSYYGEKGGHKDSHHDSKGNYNEHYSKGGSNKGGSFAEKAGQKKGQQTKAYHKIIHKDEYKKEHKFYDQADKKGYYDKYGNFHKHQEQEEGAFKKGGSSDEGHDEKEFGNKGESDKGQYDKKDEAYKGEKGQDQYYQDYSDFGSKGGKVIKAEKGYSDDY